MKKMYVIISFFIIPLSISAQQTVGLFINDSLALNGYTLFAPSTGTETYLIDNCGFIVNVWEASNFSPGASVYLLDNGNLLRTGRLPGDFGGGGLGGRIEIFSWDDELLWSYHYLSNEYHHHHDVEILPNGNILLIAWESYSNQEGIEAGRNPNLSNGNIWSEKVVELKPIGTDSAEVVWEWRLWDHLVQNYDSTKSNYGVISDHPELLNINFAVTNNVDWIHFNSISYNEDLDQILLSSRHLNEIYIIDHSTTTAEAASHSGGDFGKGGDLLFRWGNPYAYDRANPSDQKFYGQHDAKWIPNGYPDEGKIMVFNNGQGRPLGNYSSVDIINPTIENDSYTPTNNEPFEPVDLFWTYEASPPTSLYSGNISGAQRLSNGNTLICEGRPGNLYEVTNDGQIVWHYRVPINNNGPVLQGTTQGIGNIFRATRYEVDYSAFFDKDLIPSTPIELNPLPSECEINDVVGLKPVDEIRSVVVLNNPFTDYIYIKNQKQVPLFIEIFDLLGRPIISLNSNDGNIQIPAESLDNGVFVIRIFDKNEKKYLSKKVVKSSF